LAASGIHARSLGAALAVAVLALPALAGCSVSGGSGGSGSGKVHVVAGENFYGDLVSRVGGDLVSVTSVLSDPNVDPHTYESSTQNAEQVADATLVIENGLGYDAFLDHLLSASPRSDRKVIDVQQLLGLADGSNPHIWYDPQTMPRVARAVADELEAQRPDSRAIFETNLKTYLDSFAPLTAKIAQIKKDYPADPGHLHGASARLHARCAGLDRPHADGVRQGHRRWK
jgi:zinc/manganese transport system substrate-binding protein